MGWFEKLHSLYLQKMTGADLKSCVPFIYKDHWFEELCPLHLQRSHELIWSVVSPSFTKITWADLKSCVPFIYKDHWFEELCPFHLQITWANLKSCVPFIYKDHMSWFEELCPLHLQKSLILRVVCPSFLKTTFWRIVSPSFTMFTDLKSCVPFIYKDHMSWFEELCPLHLQRSHELIWRVVSPSFTKINDFKSCVPFISKNNLLKNCVPFIYKDHIVCLQIHVSHKSDFIWRIITPLFTKIENVKVSTI
jgi:hypothetical protein